MHNDLNVFSKRLKECREQKGYSISRLSFYVNISKSLLSSYENGRCFPTVKNLQAICNFLKISSDYLLGVDLTIPKSRTQILPIVNEKNSVINYRCCDSGYENCYYFKEKATLFLINPTNKYACGQTVLCHLLKNLTTCTIYQINHHFYLCPTHNKHYTLYDIDDQNIQIIGVVLEKIENLIA